MKSDPEIVAEYLDGNESAMDELVTRHIRIVYGFVYRLTGREADASDIAQETFIKMWKSIKRYDPKQNFKAWIMTIARNTAIDWMRKKKAFSFSELSSDAEGEYFEDTLADTTPLADEIFSRKETKEVIDKIISSLPLHYREVVLLRHGGELSFEEISDSLRKPVNTVKSQYRRALLKMRESLSAPKQ